MGESSGHQVTGAAGFRQGWLMVAFSFVLQFVVIGSAYYAFGVYLKYLPELLDTSRFYVSLGITLQTIVVGLMSPAVGVALARYSFRGFLLIGVVVMSTGFWLMSVATELWHIYLAFGLLVSAGMGMLGPLPNNMLIANWFEKKRGTALGISQFGLTISGTVLVPLTTWLVLEYGLPATFRMYAIAIPVILVPLILLFAVKTPEEKGLHPDGELVARPQALLEDTQEWTVRRAFRDRTVLLLVLTIGPSFLSISTILLTLPAYGTDVGLTPIKAAGVVSMATLFGACAKPLFGTFTDYVSTKLVVAVSFAFQVVGIALLLLAETYTGLLACGVFFGLGYGGMATLWAVMIGELFGRAAFARVMGAMSPLILPFNLIGLPVANLVFESTGSYAPAYAALLVGYCVSALALWRLPLVVNGGDDD